MVRTLSFVTAGGAATAGFLGCCVGCPGACLAAGILALLSLVFNLWDLFQDRGDGGYNRYPYTGGTTQGGTTVQTGTTNRPGSTGGTDRY